MNTNSATFTGLWADIYNILTPQMCVRVCVVGTAVHSDVCGCVSLYATSQGFLRCRFFSTGARLRMRCLRTLTCYFFNTQGFLVFESRMWINSETLRSLTYCSIFDHQRQKPWHSNIDLDIFFFTYCNFHSHICSGGKTRQCCMQWNAIAPFSEWLYLLQHTATWCSL